MKASRNAAIQAFVKGSNQIHIGTHLKQIPLKSDALFWLDGIVSGDQLIDKSGNNRHFTIINKDYPSDWIAGVPYKSVATISAPVGDDVLIAADVDNCLYALNGTPNQIPVTALFSDVNFAHKLFCRQFAAVVDSNGIETSEARVLDIVLYDTVKVGGELTLCQTYFNAPTKLTANFRDVGVGKTYTTITAALTAAATGDTIYIHNGTYQEASYITISKQVKIVGVGLVQINGVNDRVLSKSGAAIYFEVSGIKFNDGKANGLAVTASGTVVNKFDRCSFTNFGTLFSYDTSNGYEYTNCILASATHITAQLKSIKLTGCYYSNIITSTLTGDSSIKNSRIVMNATSAVDRYMFPIGDINMTFEGNNVTARNNIIGDANSTMAVVKTVNFNYNKIGMTDVTSGSYRISPLNLSAYATNKYLVNYNNNIVTQTGQITSSSPVHAMYVRDHAVIATRNIVISESTVIFVAFTKIFNAATTTNFADNISYNYIKTASASGLPISIGGELGLINRADYSTVIGNYVECTSVNTIHGMLLSCGKNMTIKFNRVKNCYHGIVVKTGLMDTYTANGLAYNIISGATHGIYVRGVRNLEVNNNTITSSLTAIRVDQNAVQAGSQWSENISAKNNIISGCATSFMWDQHATDFGCAAEYNQIYGSTRLLLAGATDYNSLATAQAAGKLLNCVVADPLLDANFIPDSQIAGVTLTDEIGLGIASTFGSATTTPVIVTNNQGSTWQKGAYVQ